MTHVGLALSMWQNELTDRYEEAGSSFLQMLYECIQKYLSGKRINFLVGVNCGISQNIVFTGMFMHWDVKLCIDNLPLP
jgi:hypothetical protein